MARGAAGAARSVEQVVHAYQTIERAINRHIVFQTGAIGDVHGQLKALSAQGRRTLSDLYEWTIQVEHDEDGGLDDETLDQMLSSAARLGFSEHSMAAGEIYGVLERIEMQPMTGPRPTHYTLTLAPRLWRLTLTRRSRVYQDKTHLDVVIEVLRQHGLDVGTHVFDHTEETYPTHEYVVQHDETDFAFVSRLLAYEGIHFHIKTLPGVDAIVLGDRNAHFDPVEDHEELVYHPHDFAPEDGEPRVWELHRVRQPRTACAVLRDFNWRTPHQVLRLEETADERSGYGFLDDFGAHFRDQAEGTRLARIRAQEQLVQREVYTGKTSIRGVAPGTWFELTEHPNPTLNQRYLVIATDVRMDEGHTYVCTFDAIPFSVTYRPPRTVPWPRIHGLTNAIVDGEQRSPATPVDEEGRYRVVVPLDEAATAGGRASRWVRRAQPSAGDGHGMHFPLHIGTEVALAFTNGDPDRPVIVGAVPNAATPSPVTSANATQWRMRTASGVEFEVEDDSTGI